MSDNFDHTAYALQLAVLYENPFDWDWSALQKEVDKPLAGNAVSWCQSLEEEPPILDWWGVPDAPDEASYDATIDVLAGTELHDCTARNMIENTLGQPLKDNQVTKPVLKHAPNYWVNCNFEGCGAGPYNRRADLERHQRKHSSVRRYECPAQGCKFKGAKAFLRSDKLREHITAGHSDNTLFDCPKLHDCVVTITRDCLPLHSFDFKGLQKYRKCPIPKCSFKLNAERQSMDLLQQHVVHKHDNQGRVRYADSLLQRGYDHATMHIVCAVCRDGSRFKTHQDFYRHFLGTHLPGDTTCMDCTELGQVPFLEEGENRRWHCREHLVPAVTSPSPLTKTALASLPFSKDYGNKAVRDALRQCGNAEVGPVRQHCRTLLSLWPDFEYHPLCGVFKHCVRNESQCLAL